MSEGNPPVTGVEKARCLIELLKIRAENRRQTRTIEFQVNLSLWSLVAASASFLHGKVHLNSGYGMLGFLAIAAAAVLAHYSLWMRLVQRSLDRDAARMREWTALVEKECGVPHEAVVASRGGWAPFEVCITALLLTVAGVVLWN